MTYQATICDVYYVKVFSVFSLQRVRITFALRFLSELIILQNNKHVLNIDPVLQPTNRHVLNIDSVL